MKEYTLEEIMDAFEECAKQRQDLEQENKQLKEDKKKAIEYIKLHSEMTDLQICGIENVLAFRGNLKELLAILGDKENE